VSRLHVGYVVEPPYPTFTVREILAVRQEGVRVTVFNTFRAFDQPFAEAQALKEEAVYFTPGYHGLLKDQILAAAARPIGYARAATFVVAHRLSMRLLLLAASYARIIRRSRIQFLHATYGTTPATLAMLCSWLADVPFSFTCHAYEVFLPNPTLAQKARQARFVTMVSEFTRTYAIEKYGLDPAKVHVVTLGVDTQALAPRVERNPDGRFVVCCVARMERVKGHAVLLKACRMLRELGIDVRCRLVGDGPLRATLEEEIRRLDLGDRVEILGWCRPEAVLDVLRAADAFALPAVVEPDGNRDGIPVALMEAMALGLPVVSTRVSGIPELIETDVSGILVPPGDGAALAQALERLSNDRALGSRLGQAARRRIEQSFDLRQSAGRMVGLFRETAGPPPSSGEEGGLSGSAAESQGP
jgi:glycosyltransferase involved in cell wall biosynthesis